MATATNGKGGKGKRGSKQAATGKKLWLVGMTIATESIFAATVEAETAERAEALAKIGKGRVIDDCDESETLTIDNVEECTDAPDERDYARDGWHLVELYKSLGNNLAHQVSINFADMLPAPTERTSAPNPLERSALENPLALVPNDRLDELIERTNAILEDFDLSELLAAIALYICPADDAGPVEVSQFRRDSLLMVARSFAASR